MHTLVCLDTSLTRKKVNKKKKNQKKPKKPKKIKKPSLFSLFYTTVLLCLPFLFFSLLSFFFFN